MNPSESGCVTSSHPKHAAATAARTKLGAFMKTEEDSPSWPLLAHASRNDGCRSKAELWFPSEESDGRRRMIYSTF